MLLRPAVRALVAGATALASTGASTAWAEPGAARHGAVVVAVGEDGGAAARPLAAQVYRDPALRPAIDDATARVLVGEPLAEDAAARLKDLAALRASLAHPTGEPGGDPAAADVVTRRLLASIGSDAHAVLVVSVTTAGGRSSARALDVATGAYQGVEIGATATTAADGSVAFTWPGANETLRGLLPAEPRAPAARTGPVARTAPPPLAPAKDASEKSRDRSIWSTPWFWVGLGAVVATGVTVFIVAKEAEGDAGTVHLAGRVPR